MFVNACSKKYRRDGHVSHSILTKPLYIYIPSSLTSCSLFPEKKKRPQIMSDVDDFNLDTLDAEEESEEDDEPSEVCQSIDKSCAY